VKGAAARARPAADIDQRDALRCGRDPAAERDDDLGQRLTEGQGREERRVGKHRDGDAAEEDAAGQRDCGEESGLVMPIAGVRIVHAHREPVAGKEGFRLGDARGGSDGGDSWSGKRLPSRST
jgi:hypothetical protein